MRLAYGHSLLALVLSGAILLLSERIVLADQSVFVEMREAAEALAEVDPKPTNVPGARTADAALRAAQLRREAMRAAVRGEVAREQADRGTPPGFVKAGQSPAGRAGKADKDRSKEERERGQGVRSAAAEAQGAGRGRDVAAEKKMNGKHEK